MRSLDPMHEQKNLAHHGIPRYDRLVNVIYVHEHILNKAMLLSYIVHSENLEISRLTLGFTIKLTY